LNSVQIPKCPALNTIDFIITTFHANSDARVHPRSAATKIRKQKMPTAIAIVGETARRKSF
jgi:hypothetical protein